MIKDDFLKLVEKNQDLSKYSTYKIGGKAKYFIDLGRANKIIEILNYCQLNNIEYLIIGGGSNILFSDHGFNGLVIRINNNECIFDGSKVQVGAGASLQDLVQKSAKRGLSGLEYLAGIPGTVGGAIRGNAGAYGREMADVVSHVNIIKKDNGSFSLKKISGSQLDFSYRSSIIKEKGYIIIDAILRLKQADKHETQKIVRDIIKERNFKQPYDYPSAGCVFKNIEGAGYEELKEFTVHNKVPAAKIIEDLGLKGKSMGGAKVSEKHANFIINKGGAKASDVIKLINMIKNKVKDKYGIELEEEIKIL